MKVSPLPHHSQRREAFTVEGVRDSQMRDLGRVLIGVVVIAVGALYLFDAADVLDAGNAIDHWWPTVVIAAGVLQLLERSRGMTGPLIMIAAGALLLLVTTDVLEGNVWSWVWPTALIALGLTVIARWAGAGALPREGRDDVVVASGIFGGPRVASSSRRFAGASLTAIFGGVELDLRDAVPAPDGASITATAVFGGVEIIVPHGWRLAVTGMPIFGGVDDQTRHGHLAEDAPLLRIDALSIFGGVEIKHDPKHRHRDE